MSKKPKLNQRFATKCLLFVAIFLVVFTVAQYISFIITGVEQEILIERVFTVIGLECGGLLLKRIADKIFVRKKKQAEESAEDENPEDIIDEEEEV